MSDSDRAVFQIDFAEFGLTAPDVPVVTAYDITGLDVDGADRVQAGVDVTDTVFPDNVPTVSGTVVTLSPFRDPMAGHIYRVWCGVDQGESRLFAHIDITVVLASGAGVSVTPPPLPTAANTFFFTTAVPDVAIGVDDDVALVRKSSLVVHAYQKSGGVWTRIWAFSGGDSVLLASGAAVPDRLPATDTDATFFRALGISGYDPVTDADVDHANPSGGQVTTVAQLRGGNNGTGTSSRDNTLAWPSTSYNWTIPTYVWFGLDITNTRGLTISGVTQSGVDIPIVVQSTGITRSGMEMLTYRSTGQYTQAEVQGAGYELTIAVDPAFPTTWNRYACVTQSDTPTAADFLEASAQTSATIRVLIPTSGWGDERRAYLHFALPATQEAPTIAGQPGGINLIDDFTVRSTSNTIDINGDDMRTLSSAQMVFEMADQYSLFPWIIR